MKEKIAEVKNIPEGTAKLITLKDGTEVALFHCNGKFYALANTCPHMGGPLCEGEIDHTQVTCPWHGWQFDLTSGSCTNGGWENAKTYQVEVNGDEIIIQS